MKKITVKIRLFAIARSLADEADAFDVTTDAGANVRSIRDSLSLSYPRLGLALSKMAIAVNREYASDATILHDGDEVAIIPPVSGG